MTFRQLADEMTPLHGEVLGQNGKKQLSNNRQCPHFFLNPAFV